MQCPGGRVDAFPPRRQQGDLVGEAHPDTAVVRSDGSGAEPHHVAGGAQLVEHRRAVTSDPGCQHVGLQRRRHDRGAGEHTDGLHQGLHPAPRTADSLPGREELRQRLRIDRLDLAAQGGERATTQLAEDLDVAPFAAHTLGAELAANDPTVELEGGERPGHA